MNRYAHVVVPTTPLHLQLLAFLRSLRAVLTPPEAWTYEAAARNETGQPLSSGTHSEATCWCLTGAIERVSSCEVDMHGYPSWSDQFVAIALCDTLVRRHVIRRSADPLGALARWNDQVWRRHDEVLELIDETIAHVERTAPRWPSAHRQPEGEINKIVLSPISAPKEPADG